MKQIKYKLINKKIRTYVLITLNKSKCQMKYLQLKNKQNVV